MGGILQGILGGNGVPLQDEGDILIHDGTQPAALPIGAAGEVLTSDGTTASWEPLPPTGVEVKEDDVSKVAAATAIDFGAGFSVTESPAGEANITLDIPYIEGQIQGSLYSEILADSPFVYYPCNESSGSTFADVVGGNTATLTLGTIAFTRLLPHEDDKFPCFFSSSHNAKSTTAAGVSMPIVGDLTLECVFSPIYTTSGGTRAFFTLAAPGNSGVECQFSLVLTSTNNFGMFWQNGGNVLVQTSTANAISAVFKSGERVHYVAVRDSAAKTIDFYVNGGFVGRATYAASEAIDSGASAVYWIGCDGYLQASGSVIGHCAAYNSKLSESRIVAHAKAAGLYLVG